MMVIIPMDVKNNVDNGNVIQRQKQHRLVVLGERRMLWWWWWWWKRLVGRRVIVAQLLLVVAVVTAATSAAAVASSSSACIILSPKPDISTTPTSDYRSLFLHDVPMIDVRAPIEYEKGSFPMACNLPLLTNNERHEVGICYKNQGQDAAIALGNSLVSSQIKKKRTKQWIDYINQQQQQSNSSPGGCCCHLFCFRGGLRSNIVQQWIEEETGICYPIVKGGYKAMRNYLLDELQHALQPNITELIVLCGKTGTGKTRVVQQFPRCSIDLEGLAQHRGSTFGRIPENPNQPSQIDFENSLSIAFLKLLADNDDQSNTQQQQQVVFVEDEGNRIGDVGLPHVLRYRMKCNDGIVLIEEPMEERVNTIVEDYIIDLKQRFVKLYGNEAGCDMHRDYMLNGLKRIRNRLGDTNLYNKLERAMEVAFHEDYQQPSSSAAAAAGGGGLHRIWIKDLLESYYDKMYDYQMTTRMRNSNDNNILFRGDRDSVIEWIREKAF